MIPIRRHTIGLFLIAGVITAALTIPSAVDAAFSLDKGIVGNLPDKCSVYGSCDWCDFIGLMVILQKIILSLFGGLALIMLVWGGQGIITAAGNPEHIKKSKDLIISTLLGVGIILAAYFIINIIVGILITPTGQPLKTNLFGSSWWEAQCKEDDDQTSSTSCSPQNNGTSCGDSKVCSGDQCVPSCQYLSDVNPTLYKGCQASCGNGLVPAYGGCAENQFCCITDRVSPDSCQGKNNGTLCGPSSDPEMYICNNNYCQVSCQYLSQKNQALYRGCRPSCTNIEKPVSGACPNSEVCCIHLL